jgi:hypothetical protein
VSTESWESKKKAMSLEFALRRDLNTQRKAAIRTERRAELCAKRRAQV